MWLGAHRAARATAASKGRTSVTLEPSLEMPTTITARGIAPVNAIIERLTATQCRLRAVVLLNHHQVLEFEVNLPGEAPVTVRARVVSCTSKPPRFIYTVSLEDTHERKLDGLARSLNAIHRRERSGGLTRETLRRPAEFAVNYRTTNARAGIGTAMNVSIGGMQIHCCDPLVDGELIQVRFTLPADVLDASPDETAVLFPKPFQEIEVRAHVVYHEPLGKATYEYGLKFADLDRIGCEEIARYTKAVRRSSGPR